MMAPSWRSRAPAASGWRSRGTGPAQRAIGFGAANLGESWHYGQTIYPNGDEFWSSDLSYKLWLPADGNLAIDQAGRAQQWRASDNGFKPISNPGWATLMPWGELAIFDSNGKKVWSSGVYADPSTIAANGLLLQTDGNLVLYVRGGVPGQSGVVWASQPGLSHSILPDWAKDAIDWIDTAANIALIPSWNVQTFWATGKDPITSLKEDVANFKQAATNASKVSGVSPSQAESQITDGLGNQVPDIVKQTADAAASGDTTKAFNIVAGAAGTTPQALLSDINNPDYAQAWVIATGGGHFHDSNLPAPPGLSYLPNAVPSASDAAALGQQISEALAQAKVNGVPSDKWNALTPAQQAQLQAAGIYEQGNAPASTGEKVATGIAAAGIATAVGIGIVAAMKHQAYSAVAKHLWDKAAGVFKRKA
jgi:hypothetical protein